MAPAARDSGGAPGAPDGLDAKNPQTNPKRIGDQLLDLLNQPPERPPERASLTQLVRELSPGGRLARTRRLRGGLGSRMHELDISNPDASHWKVVLRRYFAGEGRLTSPEHAATEFELLRVVCEADVPAPRPILLDAEGKYFGLPAMVLSYLPGRPLFTPKNSNQWTDGLARALLSLHAVSPERVEFLHLNVFLRDGMRAEIENRRAEALAGEPLAREIHAVLVAQLDRIDWPAPALVHDDYWPGNTVWCRGRLMGIVDWTTAEVGDPRVDVAQCRADLVLSHGLEAADAFLEAYQVSAAERLPDMWYFDLFRGLRALFSYERWLSGYHDLGLTQLSPSNCGERLREFLIRALREAHSRETG